MHDCKERDIRAFRNPVSLSLFLSRASGCVMLSSLERRAKSKVGQWVSLLRCLHARRAAFTFTLDGLERAAVESAILRACATHSRSEWGHHDYPPRVPPFLCRFFALAYYRYNIIPASRTAPFCFIICNRVFRRSFALCVYLLTIIYLHSACSAAAALSFSLLHTRRAEGRPFVLSHDPNNTSIIRLSIILLFITR